MSFDMEPDHDEHHECRREIHQLQDEVKRLRAFAEKFCPKCDGCGQLLLDGGVTEADGIKVKPCRAVCVSCHEAAEKGDDDDRT